MKRFAHLSLALLAVLILTAVNAAGLSGVVTDEAGAPLASIRVSDGFTVVLTDEDGRYELSPHERQTTVSVVTPADRRTDSFWHPVEEGRSDGYDFRLAARPKRSSFSFLQVSDLETSGWSLREFYEQLRNRLTAEGDAAFVVFSGDICRADGMKTTAREFTSETFGGLPAYISLGNHDLLPGYERGEQLYEELFGPTRYAFVEGNVLFVVLPMMYGDASPSYSLEEIVEWLKSLLATWPKDAPVFFATHYYRPYFDRGALFAPGTAAAFDLSKWKIAGAAYGHSHYYLVYPNLPVPLYNDGQSHAGGGGNMPAGARLFHVSENGSITSELVESRVTDVHEGPVLRALCDAGGHLAVTAFDSEGKCLSVTARVADKTIALRQENSWLWSARLDDRPDAPFTVTAEFRHGAQARNAVAECVPKAGSKLLKLEKVVTLPGNRVLFGKPAVDGSRVYVGLADEDNGENGGVCAVEAATGEVVWKHVTGFSVRNSVALDQGMLYFADADNNLYKVRADDGTLVWKNPVPSADLCLTNHGSVSLGEGKVFAGCSSLLRAVDQRTGQTAWVFHKGLEEFGTTQTPLYSNGRVFYGGNWGFGCFALKAADGSLLWDTATAEPGFQFQPTLAILPEGNLLRAEGDRSLTVFSAETGEMLRQMEKPERLYTSSAPMIYHGVAYCAADTVGLLAVDLETLQRKWDAEKTVQRAIVATIQYRPQMTTVEAAPVIVEGKLLVAAMDGFLYFLNPDDGSPLDSFEVGAPLLGSPAFADGKLYVTDYAGRLLIFQVKK